MVGIFSFVYRSPLVFNEGGKAYLVCEFHWGFFVVFLGFFCV